MRWRIPIAGVLIVFAVSGCEQQPLEPQAAEVAVSPLFAPNSTANKWVWEADETWSEICTGGETIDVAMVGWGQFMAKKGSHNWGLDVFHLVFTFSYDGATFVYRDVGPDRWYCVDSECYVAISGRSSASGTPARDEINLGHAVMKLDGPFGTPVEVVFIAGQGLGALTDLACDALT